MPTRKSSAVWEGGLKDGKGRYNVGSGGVGGAYNFGSRFEEEAGSNPEELLAAAEAACYSMALSGGLEKNGTPPKNISTNAECTVEKGDVGFQITTMRLDVTATVPNIDNAKFQEIANATLMGCPVSKVFAGNLQLQLNARLV
ncbi:MAG: OsmC family peroxiredoxin [Gemmatimonadaceae bacterium]